MLLKLGNMCCVISVIAKGSYGGDVGQESSDMLKQMAYSLQHERRGNETHPNEISDTSLARRSALPGHSIKSACLIQIISVLFSSSSFIPSSSCQLVCFACSAVA